MVGILKAVRAKSVVDQDNDWFKGSGTYLNELKKEIVEVEAELESDSVCYLEDELGDLLWDYLSYVVALEGEGRVNLESVIRRARKKYSERIEAIGNGTNWAEVKRAQKDRLASERHIELKSME